MTSAEPEAVVPIPWEDVPSPCYIVHTGLLEQNLRRLDSVQQRTGAKIILALKGFAMFSAFPWVRRYLKGTTASSLNEARLGFEEFGGEVHVYAVAYLDHEFDEMLRMASHITFNSFTMWNRFKARALAAARPVEFGLRINPEYSEVKIALYNPCARGSRFGMTASQFEGVSLEGLTGMHFHTLCEQNSDALEHTLDVVLPKFGPILKGMKWLNMGGGHHITRPDYDVDRLCRNIDRVRDGYGVDVVLEPGEAVALNTGFLVASVVDLFDNAGVRLAILDVSATAHMPDVLEMPYRPVILGSGQPGEKPHLYRLGGLTCLAGDVIGDYSFDRPLEIGQKLVFTDMAHYTMVKNSTFNGVPLPSIALFEPGRGVKVVRRFGYEDYRNRLS